MKTTESELLSQCFTLLRQIVGHLEHTEPTPALRKWMDNVQTVAVAYLQLRELQRHIDAQKKKDSKKQDRASEREHEQKLPMFVVNVLGESSDAEFLPSSRDLLSVLYKHKKTPLQGMLLLTMLPNGNVSATVASPDESKCKALQALLPWIESKILRPVPFSTVFGYGSEGRPLVLTPDEAEQMCQHIKDGMFSDEQVEHWNLLRYAKRLN